MKEIDQVPELVQRLYEIVRRLERLFPQRHFTPDGHLVGSIGEVMAAFHYGLELLPASTEKHDAKTKDKDRKFVQVKTTQRKSIGLRDEPDYLIVQTLSPEGYVEEVYNGPGKLAWANVGSKQSNGQYPISINKFRELKKEVKPEFSITRFHV